MSLVPSDFVESVAAIGELGESDHINYIATAFLFGHPGSSQSSRRNSYWRFVVTNRHVVLPARQLWIRFRAPGTNQDSDPFPIPVEESSPGPWITHPDPNIDLAILPLDAVPMPSEFAPDRFLTLDRHVITREELRSSECDEGNEVFILGFPLGIAGTSQNDVTVRNGIIARIKDWYDGRSKDFLIDSFIYPGNSGGPVVLKPVLWSSSHKPRVIYAKLLGLVSGYLAYTDVALSQQTGKIRHISEENSGLAQVVPIDAVVELTTVIAEVFDRSPGSFVTFETIRTAVAALVPNHMVNNN